MPRFGPFSGERRRSRDVVATLALSLCRLRGVPPLSDREIDALLKIPTAPSSAETLPTREVCIDALIAQLDGLIRERDRR